MSSSALPCRKFFISQLSEARLQERAMELSAESQTSASRVSFIFGRVEFQRVWIQGMLVSQEDSFFQVDDGTGVIWVDISKLPKRPVLQQGAYLMVIGSLAEDVSVIGAHKIVELTDTDRESMWHFEVVEVQRLHYLDSK